MQFVIFSAGTRGAWSEDFIEGDDWRLSLAPREKLRRPQSGGTAPERSNAATWKKSIRDEGLRRTDSLQSQTPNGRFVRGCRSWGFCS